MYIKQHKLQIFYQKYDFTFYANNSKVQMTVEPVYEISNNVVCVTSKASDLPVHMHSLIRAFASRLNTIGVLSY